MFFDIDGMHRAALSVDQSGRELALRGERGRLSRCPSAQPLAPHGASVLGFPGSHDLRLLQVLVSRTGEDRSEISVRGSAVNRLTRDHRPDDLAEAERIQAEGGEVRRLRPGSGTSRIFAPGAADRWAEVASVRIANGADELLLLGTDGQGLWIAAGRVLRPV
eukprot:Skav219796  [mRNA]  locus=scaffold147:96098:97980:- [translate_table: standard]